MKPTDEQIRGFWVLLGWKQDTIGNWVYPPQHKNKHFSMYGIPDIDLNNLFKYAVPKLGGRYDIRIQNCLEGWYVLISQPYGGEFEPIRDKDPALALFWAIYEVIK